MNSSRLSRSLRPVMTSRVHDLERLVYAICGAYSRETGGFREIGVI